VVAGLVTVIVVRLIGRIDWAAVYDALRDWRRGGLGDVPPEAETPVAG
jgi:hypothetical protein